MSCKKCGCETTEVKIHGINYAHLCSDCGAFQRWAKKDEAPVESEAETDVDDTCEYCDQEYVIPKVYDGGITVWEHIDHRFCPLCGRKQ